MKNKKLLIPILVIILIIAVILVLKFNINKNSNKQNEDSGLTENNSDPTTTISQNLYPVGDYDLEDTEKNKLFKSYDEFSSYLTSTYTENFEELLSKYSENFFEEGALALTYIKLENPRQIIYIDSLNIDENNLEIGYSIKETLEEHSSAYIAIVETDKTLSTVTSVQL